MFGAANLKTPCGKHFAISSISESLELGMVLHINPAVQQSLRAAANGDQMESQQEPKRYN